MKRFPEPGADYGSIIEMITQPIRSRLLWAAIELGIFDVLTDFSSSEEVSKRLNTHPGNTYHLLDGLASCDLLEKRNHMFRNTDIANIFLTRQSDYYLGSLIEIYQSQFLDPLEGLTEMVRKGPDPLLKSKEYGEDEIRGFVEALVCSALGGRAQEAVEIVRRLPEFSTMRMMLDIGGGPGIIAMAIVESHPSMKGVVFETPGMARFTKEYVAKFGMKDRIKVVSGDFLTDPVEGIYDLIWASFCLYFAKDCLDDTIAKILNALKPGGIFISIHEGLINEGTKPEIMVLPNIVPNMAGQPFAFEHRDIAEAMKRTGFSEVISRFEDSPFGEVELVIGKR